MAIDGGPQSDRALASPGPEYGLAAGATATRSVRQIRVIGLRDLVLFYLVTGVSLRWLATAAAAGPSSIVVWLAAWATFYIPLALAVIELSSRYPDEGGLYVWTKHALGDFSGFLAAWSYWTSNLPYFPALLYFAASNALFMGGPGWQSLASNRLYFLVFSLLGLALPTVLNVRGLNLGKWLNNLGAMGMWIPVVFMVALGLVSWHRYGSATHFTAAGLVPSFHIKDALFWSSLAFAFGGCEAASLMAEEIKDPRRNIPRALLAGGAVVTVIYIVGTVFVLLAVPSREVNEIQGLIQALSVTSHHLGALWVIPAAALLISLSNLGQSGAYLAATARLPFVAGIDRYLPPVFGRLHPRYKTPDVAIWTQSIACVVFIVLGQAGTSVKGAYDVLVSMCIITYFIPYLFVFASLIVLQREPAPRDVIRVPGGKPVAIVLGIVGFATTSVAILLSVLPGADEPKKLLAVGKVLGLTVILLAVGVLLYRNGKARVKKG
jgi:glutamate:GABA antiporter